MSFFSSEGSAGRSFPIEKSLSSTIAVPFLSLSCSYVWSKNGAPNEGAGASTFLTFLGSGALVYIAGNGVFTGAAGAGLTFLTTGATALAIIGYGF